MRRAPSILLLVVVACGGAGGAAPHAMATLGPPDPGGHLERRTGQASLQRLPDLTVPATAVAAENDHFYVEVPFDRTTAGHGQIVRVAVGGARFGFAVPSNHSIIVRLVGASAPADGLELTWFAADPEADLAGGALQGGLSQRIHITGIGAARAQNAFLPKDFFSAAVQWFSARGETAHGVQPFFAFAHARLQTLASGTDDAEWANNAWQRDSRLTELMSLYTGLESVEESMQVDRGLLLNHSAAARADATVHRTVDVNSIAGVPLPAHPWDKMLAEPGAPRPVVEPLAAVVPADMLYLYFHDLRTFVALADEVDGWAWPLLETLEQRGGASHLVERYEEQLAVERTELAKRLGNLVADGVAIVASDPLLREGTDVSLVFKVKNRALLIGMLDELAARVVARHTDAAKSEYQLGGVTVKLLATPDHRVYRHQLELGDVLVISNSRAALARFIDVRDGKRPSLAASGDFRWMRAMYPFDPANEDGFAFAGDSLIAGLVGPRVKILESRRIEAQADLLAVNHAALLFGWLEGRAPRDLAELLASRLLRREELAHAGGEPIGFEGAAGASSAWGNVESLTPLIELTIDKVSPAEEAAYQRFVTSYQDYWRGYIDPIAVRIRRQDDGKRLAFDARILPLITASDYDHVLEEVGEKTIAPPVIAGGAQLTLAIGADAGMRRDVDGLARELTGRHDIGLAWLGDWVAVGVADRGSLWDVALTWADIPGLGERHHADEEAVNAHIPLYVAAQVKNRVGLAAMLTAAHAFVDASAAGLVDWHAGAPYHGVETVTIEEKPAPGRKKELGGATLHYAIPGDQLILSLDRATLEQQIDRVLAGEVATAAAPAQVALMLASLRVQGWLARTVAALLEKDALVATHVAMLAHEAIYFGTGGASGSFAVAVANPAERRRLALAYLGFEPSSPQAGELSVDAIGLVHHSLYGSDVEPALPDTAAEATTPLARVVDAIASLSLTLAFEGEKDRRGLHATGEWLWR